MNVSSLQNLIRSGFSGGWNISLHQLGPQSRHLATAASRATYTQAKEARHAVLAQTSLRSSSDNLLSPTFASESINLTPVEDGCGGVYFVTGRDGHKLSVFKPLDEECSRENNPKGRVSDYYPRDDLGGAPREVAAYHLDQRYGGFSGVPMTALAAVSNADLNDRPGCERGSEASAVMGSIQEFVSHEDSAENMGASGIPADEVHKIGVLDIRLVNNDRHFANILCRSGADGKLQLTPIDHGAVLPSCYTLGNARFEWMYWKQAKEPFSEETMRHIESLNPEKDAEFLRSMKIFNEACIVTMVLATKLLQLGAKNGLTLWDIGNAIQRDLFDEDRRSILEQAIFDLLGEAPSEKEILDASGDVAVEVVSHSLANVDYLTRKQLAMGRLSGR